MIQFDRHTFPAGGGWTFRQPQTGWTNPMAMVGFDASVKAIIAHRKANPAITSKHKLSTNPVLVANELENYTRLRLGIPTDPPEPSFFQPRRNLPQKVVGVAADIKRAAQGTAVVLDWLVAGGPPVAQELANKRAAVCAECPKNVPGHWFTEGPAEIIKNTLEARKDLTLNTPHDAVLQSCDVCKCLMRLKVWVPLQHITQHTSPEVLKEFPANCWIARRDG